MKNDEVYKPAFLRHSTFLVHYSIFLFGCGFAAVRTGEFLLPPGNKAPNLPHNRIFTSETNYANSFFINDIIKDMVINFIGSMVDFPLNFH
jgi:hypothetical protein